MMDTFDISNRKILVAGGTRGIGRAISKDLARAGGNVLANYVRDTSAAESLIQEAAEEALTLETIRADLTMPKSIDSFMEHVDEFLGEDKLSGLVYCAATGVHKPIDELTVRHYDWTFNLNIRALVDLCGRLKPYLSEGASVVVLSSLGAIRGGRSYSLVGASKGALESFARHLAMEWAERGLRVNIVRPGTVETEAWKAMPDNERRLAEAKDRSPAKRLVTPEEVANSVRFLLSRASTGINGATLDVDLGESIPI